MRILWTDQRDTEQQKTVDRQHTDSMPRTTACLLLVLVVLVQSCCLVSAGTRGSRTRIRSKLKSSGMYRPLASNSFPDMQPPACTAECLDISAAPKCCSRGHGIGSSVGSGDMRWDTGHRSGATSSPAPLKRQRYDRYTGAADAEARDQQLPVGCLMVCAC